MKAFIIIAFWIFLPAFIHAQSSNINDKKDNLYYGYTITIDFFDVASYTDQKIVINPPENRNFLFSYTCPHGSNYKSDTDTIKKSLKLNQLKSIYKLTKKLHEIEYLPKTYVMHDFWVPNIREENMPVISLDLGSFEDKLLIELADNHLHKYLKLIAYIKAIIDNP